MDPDNQLGLKNGTQDNDNISHLPSIISVTGYGNWKLSISFFVFGIILMICGIVLVVVIGVSAICLLFFGLLFWTLGYFCVCQDKKAVATCDFVEKQFTLYEDRSILLNLCCCCCCGPRHQIHRLPLDQLGAVFALSRYCQTILCVYKFDGQKVLTTAYFKTDELAKFATTVNDYLSQMQPEKFQLATITHSITMLQMDEPDDSYRMRNDCSCSSCEGFETSLGVLPSETLEPSQIQTNSHQQPIPIFTPNVIYSPLPVAYVNPDSNSEQNDLSEKPL